MKIIPSITISCMLLLVSTFVIAEPIIKAVNDNYVNTDSNEYFHVKGFIKEVFQSFPDFKFRIRLTCSDYGSGSCLLTAGDIDVATFAISNIGNYVQVEVHYVWENLIIDSPFDIQLFPPPIFGDVDNSSNVDIDDVTYLLNYIFTDGPAPIPFICIGDANGDGAVDIDDVVYLISYIFSGGPGPVDDCCFY